MDNKKIPLSNSIIWSKIERRVFAIQKRLYKAALLSLKSLIRFFQNILVLSLDAKLLAIRLSSWKFKAAIILIL